MKRAEARELRLQTVVARRREAAVDGWDLAQIEWDALRARIRRVKDPVAQEAAWRNLAGVLAGLNYR